MDADLIRIIEAAYATSQSEADWIAGLCEAVQPALDVGLGVIVATVDISSGDVRYSNGAARGNSLEAIMAWGRAQPQRPEDALLPLCGSPTISLSDVFGDRLLSAVPMLPVVTAQYGIRDALGVMGINPDGQGVGVAALLAERTRVTPRVRARWDRIATHLAAAGRLRKKLGLCEPTPEFRLRVEGAEAVLAPDGRVEHAVGTARQPATREQLRAAAVSVDRARAGLRRSDPDAAVALWKTLVDGQWSLVDRFDSDGRRFLLAQRNEVPTPACAELRRREAAVLTLRAQGRSIKLICYELGLRQSTVARALAKGMRRLGFDSIADLARLRVGQATATGKKNHGVPQCRRRIVLTSWRSPVNPRAHRDQD